MATIPAKKPTNKLQINCEVASEIIAEYFAFCAKQLAAERRSSAPNQDKIKTLEQTIAELHREKLELGVDNVELINKALYRYAPILKRAKS